MLDIPPEKMQRYLAGAKLRQQQQQQALEQRRQRAKAVARDAAEVLKTEFGASRVVLFGSVVTGHFHLQSDIDLAVWDLPEECYLQAVSRLLGLSEFSIDLVMVQTASSYVRDAIAQGQVL